MQAGGPPVTRTQQRFFLAILCYKKNQNGDDSWEAVVFSCFFGGEIRNLAKFIFQKMKKKEEFWVIFRHFLKLKKLHLPYTRLRRFLGRHSPLVLVALL
jgi:hypothetical protein